MCWTTGPLPERSGRNHRRDRVWVLRATDLHELSALVTSPTPPGGLTVFKSVGVALAPPGGRRRFSRCDHDRTRSIGPSRRPPSWSNVRPATLADAADCVHGLLAGLRKVGLGKRAQPPTPEAGAVTGVDDSHVDAA